MTNSLSANSNLPTWSWLTLCLGILLSQHPETYWPVRIVSTQYRFFDLGGLKGFTDMLADDQVCGRDLIYNYGPLYQLTHSLGLWIDPGDPAVLLKWHDVIEDTLIALGLWVVMTWVGGASAARNVVFLVWIGLITVPDEMYASWLKPMAGPLLLALVGRCTAGFANGSSPSRWLALMLSWGLTAPLLAAFSFDLGVVALLALTLLAGSLGAAAWWSPANPGRRPLAVGALVGWVSAIATTAAAVWALQQSAAWQHYLPDTWELAMGYTVALAEGCSPIAMGVLVLTGALILAVLCYLMRTLAVALREQTSHVPALCVLLAGGCFALVWLRYGLSSTESLRKALCPTLLWGGALLPLALWRSAADASCLPVSNPRVATWQGWSLGLLVLLLGLAPLTLSTAPGRTLLNGWYVRIVGLPMATWAPPKLELPEEELSDVIEATRNLTDTGLLVWPYGAIIGVLADKVNPALTVQPCDAHTDGLELRSIARLEQFGRPPVVLFKAARDLRGVRHLTRTPALFRYLLEQYELVETPTSMFARLVPRRHGPRPWEPTPLQLPAAPFAWDPAIQPGVTIDLPSEQVSLSDLLLLKLRVAQTPLVAVRKPGRIWVTFHLSDGTVEEQPVLVPPDGNVHELLLSPVRIQEPAVLSWFSPNRMWRATETIQQIELRWEPLDWLSATPAAIEIAGIDLLRPADAEIMIAPRGEQLISQPLLEWSYGDIPATELRSDKE
jgi:hypothetical protein